MDSASLLAYPPSYPLCPLRHTRSAPSVIPAGPPLCHSRRWLAGIQCLSLLSLHSCGLAWESHGFPIKNVGNDSGGSKTSGMTGAES